MCPAGMVLVLIGLRGGRGGGLSGLLFLKRGWIWD